MPKQSYAQEVAALEETVAAARSRADVLPPLALVVASQAWAKGYYSPMSQDGGQG